MRRFVVQAHTRNNRTHYDLMLESGETLKTWQMDSPPDQIPQTTIKIQDHRLIYLEYEGEISNNRGSVKIWDKGNYATIKEKESGWVISLRGKLLDGGYQISFIEGNKWKWNKLPLHNV
jgi:hypothetical protein